MQVKDSNKRRTSTILLGILCFVLQVAISPNIGMGNGRINFALVFSGVYALSVGGSSAVWAGFVSGLVFDLLSTGPLGLMSALLTVFSLALGMENRNRFSDGFVNSLSSFGMGSVVVTLLYHLTMSLLGEPTSVMDLIMLRTLPTFALTFVAFLPFAYAQVHKAAASHGLGTGASGASKRGASHYDVSNL